MRLSKMFVKHCPEIAELYITPRNLGFYECNGVEAIALGAHVVQDTGQAGALIIGGATVGITPQGLYYMAEHDLLVPTWMVRSADRRTILGCAAFSVN